MLNIALCQKSTITFKDNILAWVDDDTKLMWEVKNKNNINTWYVWHESYIKKASSEVREHLDEQVKDCTSYVERMNEERYGGFDDWRLPSLEELKSLSAEAENDLFIKTPLLRNSCGAYWSATPTQVVDVYRVPGMDWRTSAHIPSIYIMDFQKSTPLAYRPCSALWIRCVRSMST